MNLMGKKVIVKTKKSVISKTSFGPSRTDPLGMYTGVPLDKDEMPEQDADDL